MGKICWINGQPYLVSLSSGGIGDDNHNNQWDEMISFLGEDCDRIFHWKNMHSWCQDVVDASSRAVRGYNSARRWDNYYATGQYVGVGFRPVLVPLDPDTMRPDTSLLEDIPDGSRIALASLYMDGKAVAEPQEPTYDGDIADYVSGAEITLGDRDEDSKNWLHVIKFKDSLWVDRNVLKNISWNELKAEGFTGES